MRYLMIALFFILILKLDGQSISIKDYERAISFAHANYNDKTAYNLNPTTFWFEEEAGLYFFEYSNWGKKYRTVDFDSYEVRDLFDHEKLANALSVYFEEEILENEIGIYAIQKVESGQYKFDYKGKSYLLDTQSYSIKEGEESVEIEDNPLEEMSPDSNWVAFSRDYNVFIKSVSTNEELQLSFDGEKDNEYANRYGWFDKMEGENGDRPENFTVSWSPDSKWLFTHQWDTRNADKMYLLDWSKDHLYRPELLSYYRGSPGDSTMVMIRPALFNIDRKQEVSFDLPTQTHINGVSVYWSENTGQAYARYPERGYQKEYVKQIDLMNEKVTTIIEETSTTNIDNFFFRPWDEFGKLLFLSERSGWRLLYAYDIEEKTTSLLTKGDYFIHEFIHMDEEEGVVYFTAAGKEKNVNPYYRMLYKVSIHGGDVQLLTPEPLNHSINYSHDWNCFVDNMSNVQTPTKSVLRSAKDGQILAHLNEANVDFAISNGWTPPEVFEFLGKDKKTTLYGAIWKPSNFDPAKKYPIIDHSYTGPHTQVFPTSFSRTFNNQALAELGFVVMMVDGLGTFGRSKEFHNYSYKNMGDNLADHVLAIEYLAKTRPWVDSNKVGIFGHSAGGYDAGHAVLAFPDVYKVSVASSADHDFRMEKAWWPEMYMGWPVDEKYNEVSNITMAGNLKGKLLLVHGALDDNVNPSATFKLAEALVRADKEFDLLILPSQRHGYTGDFRKYFIKKRWNYFVEHLLGAEPIWDFKWE